ncbi:MAG: hypothetical protein ACI88A_003253 [Paraglaciecola sp.]
MNQAIQIQDGYTVQNETMCIELIVSGLMMECHISAVPLADMQAFYINYQFDLEEIISDFAEREIWNEDGIIHINSKSLIKF